MNLLGHLGGGGVVPLFMGVVHIDLAKVLNKLAPQQMMYTASILCASMKIRPNSTIDLHFNSGLWDSHMNIINNIVRGALCVHLLHQV